MKPTSIIFLIVAVALVIGGFTTAGVAKQMAATNGIDLSITSSEGSSPIVTSHNYGADNIGKIQVDARDATVTVIGGADTPYVELVNFTEGMYELSAANRVLVIKEGADFTSLSGIASLVTNFKGLRSFVNYYNMRNLEKRVNIYICNEFPVNAVEISLGTGDVTVNNITASSDISIDIGEGTLTMTDINTTSSVEVNIGNGNAELDNCYIEQMTVSIGEGEVNAKAKINRLDADIDTGDFVYDFSGSLGFINTKLFTSSGSIILNGEKIGGFRETSDVSTQNIIDISIGVGDIIINTN